ncbi:hypothetical protein P3T36_003379 [Kitasatospora sp. MAP12-15]|uniref:DUF317 domain-containing protein n=2 Tax=Kitasatospora TaxID=2063 RepID=UPI00247D9855|nr:hypothetical protein [Kitasatospora sp. MAP12-44]
MIEAVEAAVRGIRQAELTFDAISDSLCDEQGFVADHAAWDRHVVRRDLSAWTHMQTVLLHGSAYLDHVRQNVVRLNPDADTRRSWTYHLRALETALDNAHRQQAAWPAPGPFLGDDDRSREDLAAETWSDMNEWARHGPVAADILRRAESPVEAPSLAQGTAATRTSSGPVLQGAPRPAPPSPPAAVSASERPGQLVLVSPLYLAGPGSSDVEFADRLFFEQGWTCPEDAAEEVVLRSPCRRVSLALEDGATPGGSRWAIIAHGSGTDVPLWRVAFDDLTPVEITDAFAQATARLIRDDPEEALHGAPAPEASFDVVSSVGWTVQDTPLRLLATSPDNKAAFVLVDRTDPTQPLVLAADSGVPGRSWIVSASQSTPAPLLDTLMKTAAVSGTALRRRADIPTTHLPHVTCTPWPAKRSTAEPEAPSSGDAYRADSAAGHAQARTSAALNAGQAPVPGQAAPAAESRPTQVRPAIAPIASSAGPVPPARRRR